MNEWNLFPDPWAPSPEVINTPSPIRHSCDTPCSSLFILGLTCPLFTSPVKCHCLQAAVWIALAKVTSPVSLSLPPVLFPSIRAGILLIIMGWVSATAEYPVPRVAPGAEGRHREHSLDARVRVRGQESPSGLDTPPSSLEPLNRLPWEWRRYRDRTTSGLPLRSPRDSWGEPNRPPAFPQGQLQVAGKPRLCNGGCMSPNRLLEAALRGRAPLPQTCRARFSGRACALRSARVRTPHMTRRQG